MHGMFWSVLDTVSVGSHCATETLCYGAGGYSGEPVDGLGECVMVEGLDDILCMAWKADNAGPHDVNEACILSSACNTRLFSVTLQFSSGRKTSLY